MSQDKLTKDDKFLIMILMLDVMESMTIEVSDNMKHDIKYAINNALRSNKLVTKKMKHLVKPFAEEFGTVADDLKLLIENFYKGKVNSINTETNETNN